MNNSFTIRLKPLDSESLTSYLIRLCNSNMVNFRELIKRVTKLKRFRTDNIHLIDVYPEQLINFKQLCEIVGKSESDLLDLTFVPLISKFIDSDTGDIDTYFNMVLRQFHGYFRRVCNQCFREKRYHKLIWQVREIEICNIHNIKLQDHCCGCNQKRLYNMWTFEDCTRCHLETQSIETEGIDSIYLDEQIQKYFDWWYLLEPTNLLVQKYPGISKENALAITLLYVSQGKDENYSSTRNKVFSKDASNAFKSFIQDREYKRDSRPYINQLWKVLRHKEINMSLQEFSRIKVPDTFLESVNNTYKVNTLGPCLTSWCAGSGTNIYMRRIRTITIKDRQYKLASVCTKCFIRYGYHRKKGQWEEIGNRIDQIIQVGSLLRKGHDLESVREECKIGMETIYEILGYLLYHQLISLKDYQFTTDHSEQLSIVDCFDKMVRDTRSLRKRKLRGEAKKLFGWNTPRFYYYLATEDIQKYFLFHLKSELSDEYDRVNKILIQKMEYYLNHDIEITIKKTKEDLRLADYHIRRLDLIKIITEAREKQIHNSGLKLWSLVKEFIDEKRSAGFIFTFEDVSKYIKLSEYQIRKNHPKLYRYIREEVKVDRKKIADLKSEERIKRILDVRNDLIMKGERASKTAVAKILGISLTRLSDHIRRSGCNW